MINYKGHSDKGQIITCRVRVVCMQISISMYWGLLQLDAIELHYQLFLLLILNRNVVTFMW